MNSSYAGIAPEARGALATLDPITRQQYLDFIKCRRFRETLLCRHDVALDRQESTERMRALSFTAARRVRAMQQDASMPAAAPEPPGEVTDGGAELAVMRALLDILRAAEPNALPFDAMFDQLRGRVEKDPLPDRANPDLEAFVLASLQAGVIEPHVASPVLAYPPGDRPTASAVVRAQLADGDIVTSLWHSPVKVDDDVAKRLLPLLDGSRDRGALLAAMSDLLATSGSADATSLDGHLLRLAKLALLIA